MNRINCTDEFMREGGGGKQNSAIWRCEIRI